MARREITVAILGLGIAAGLMLVSRRAQAAMALTEESAYSGSILDSISSITDFDLYFEEPMPATQQDQQNLAAFLALIRAMESNNDYSIIYGGQHFDDFSAHPQIRVPINLPGYEGQFSTAAGAYQFNYPTWREVAAALGLTDFSPEAQDAGAIELLRKIGALDYIYSGDFDAALRIASKRWASLPYSTAGQNPRSLTEAQNLYASAGGTFA